MVLTDGKGLPLSVDIESASLAEVNLIEPLIDQAVTAYVPDRLIYDRAADSDPLRERLAARGIDLICPHRRRRVRPATQDGRKLRRFAKRWKVDTLDQLAAILPPPGDTLRVLLVFVSRIRQNRLSDGRVKTVLKPALYPSMRRKHHQPDR